MGDSQSQKTGDNSLPIQVGRDVIINLTLPYAGIAQRLRQEIDENGSLIWQIAQAMVREAGAQPGGLPAKILLPLLQYASLEDDEYLQEHWAALLANAGIAGTGVHPAFPGILRQLRPSDARFLDVCFEAYNDAAYPPVNEWVNSNGFGTWHTLMGLWERGGFKESLSLTVDNLVRLNLLSRQTVASKDESPDITILPTFDHFSITELGRQFVSACKAPSRPK
jgi:hypothetical protein